MIIKKLTTLFIILIYIVFIHSQIKYNENIVTQLKKPVDNFDINNNIYLYNAKTIKYNNYDNCLYVLDSGNFRVVKLNVNLNFVSKFGNRGQGPGEFLDLSDICFYNDNIIILDNKCKRIQILKNDGEYLNSFIYKDNINYLTIDNYGRIYINCTDGDSLYSIYNIEGKEIKRFGKLIEKNADRVSRISNNRSILVFDKDENIYVTFVNQPIIQKYDKNYNLITEIKIDYLPEIINIYEQWKKSINEVEKKYGKGNIPKFIYGMKYYVFDISIYRNLLYILLKYNTIYVFDIYTGHPIKKIIFSKNYTKELNLISFEAGVENFLYAIDTSKMTIFKYKK